MTLAYQREEPARLVLFFFFFSFIFFLVSPFSFHHQETKPAMFASEYYFNNDQLQITLQIKNKNDQLRSPTYMSLHNLYQPA